MKITRRQILAVGVVVALIGFGVYSFFEQVRLNEEGIISLSSHEMTYPDGRDVRISIGGNDNGRTVAVMVHHFGTIDPLRRVVKPGVTDSSLNAFKGLLSNGWIVQCFPANSEVSGIWVDGKKRPVIDRMVVIYISEKFPARDVVIADAEQERFLADAKGLDPLVFIERWITPRLTP